MRNLTIYLAVTACLFATKMTAQETFDEKVRNIAQKIELVTKEEKALLKKEVDQVNKEVEAGKLSYKEGDAKKLLLAETRSTNIETKVAQYEAELKEIVQQKVDGKIKDPDTLRKFHFVWRSSNWKKDVRKRDSIYNITSESRTTSQFVFALGINNLVTDGAVANSDFRYAGSHFYEWGTAWNTRLAKNNNLLHLKYGISVMYNNLRATDNRLFVDNGNTTDLETSAIDMKDSRFRNVNLVVPVHLEFDFTPKREHDGKQIFKTHKTFRFGIGGYAGVNVKSKQIIKYDIDGYKSREVTKGNFNVNDFVYGVSTYIGYKETSIYLKYDLNPMFKNNVVDQNNISLGVRFDFN
ncbi:MAG: hypothetical protein EOO46_07650 [Flavobacterium sp.]|nr:MAG: hypothetical protein EOO46_07650 [Flavobacterium sp.]